VGNIYKQLIVINGHINALVLQRNVNVAVFISKNTNIIVIMIIFFRLIKNELIFRSEHWIFEYIASSVREQINKILHYIIFFNWRRDWQFTFYTPILLLIPPSPRFYQPAPTQDCYWKWLMNGIWLFLKHV